MTTYSSIQLNYPAIFAIFYSLPLMAILILKKDSLRFLEIDNKECMFILIVLLFTIVIAANILDDKSLFMSNGVRIFSRTQVAAKGLDTYGAVPIYNPGIAQGEATYLWNTPSFKVHVALADYLLKSKSPILLFNAQSFFILFLSALSLGILYKSITNYEESNINMLAVTATAVIIGLNFYFLQMLESFKAYYIYPIAYLFLSIILDNPKEFNDFLILMYIPVLFITAHLPYGSGVILIGAILFLITKSYYLKDKSEMHHFIGWIIKNKLKIAATLIIIFLLPVFYLSSSFIYKDSLDQSIRSKVLNFGSIMSDAAGFFKGLYYDNVLSLRYPDVNRLDDHKIGFFISVFGMASFFFLLFLYKSNSTHKFRIFAFAYILNLVVCSLIEPKIGILLGGGLSYRTAQPYLLILMGASLVTLIHFFKNKYIKYALIIMIVIAFVHTIPYARQNITNVHKEYFASGEVYKEELDFIKKLPMDGRIMTYGLFSNAVDFGSNYLTDRYFSRNERTEFNIERNLFEKVHGQNSFGDPNLILSKSGTELSNYLILGGYKYLFVNGCHPIGNYVVSVLYPNFTYPIYQNNCLLFLVVNNTNYAEKVDLVKKVPDEAYMQKNGYKYIALSPYYSFGENLDFKETPKTPEALKFQRLSPTEVQIFGNFEDNDFVVFKEEYFPRWKAYMDNKEIPVLVNNNNMILIKTGKGSSILLKYVVLFKEKIFGALSFIAYLGLIVLIAYMLRQARTGSKLK